MNGLAFPPFKGGVVIFGLGYGVGDIAAAAGLKGKRIIYWGDIDTHGFGILSMLRGKLPHVESILMSCRNIDQNRDIAGVGSNETRRTDVWANLTAEEGVACSRLLPGGDCDGLRIEQEKISYSNLLNALSRLQCDSRQPWV